MEAHRAGEGVAGFSFVEFCCGAPAERRRLQPVEGMQGAGAAADLAQHEREAVLPRVGAEAQQHRASGLALVTAAIALWNSVYLGRALDALRRRGKTVPDALLAHLAPLGWQHVNLTGDYLWGTDAGLHPDGFRPLRGALMGHSTAAA